MREAKVHPAFQKFAMAVCRIAFRLFFGYRVVGQENIPDGPCVIVPNHVQLNDPVFIGITITGHGVIRSMAKKEVFSNPLLGRLVTWLGAFPVDREQADLSAIRTALGTVKEGHKLLIFPQGTRGGEEVGAKSGAAMIALRTGAPLLPVYLPPKKTFRSRPTVVIGEPYVPAKTRDYGKTANEIMEHIYALKSEAV